ncbi:MAG: hypothetical protein ACI4XG_27645 [Bradyrhizobium sp.]
MPQEFADLPVGFGMALAQNAGAMEAFGTLPEPERARVIAQARQADTRQQMQQLVEQFARI